MSTISTCWYRPGAIPAAELRELAEMFAEVADDFVPPLTAREGTTQADLGKHTTEAAEPGGNHQGGNQPTGNHQGGNQPGGYLESMLRQDMILCRTEDQAVGFLSFRSGHSDPRYADLSPCLYVSTVAVRHHHRRRGVADALYRELFALPASMAASVVLRTWSTNAGHLELLGRLGFTTILRLEDDRGAGVDTLYLATDRTKADAVPNLLPGAVRSSICRRP
ncbi:GNAT family N-acetyltransferase [Streptomycetaceae bacterium NBC_01309]